MQVKILGSAAGGGFPQWNCACPNCRGLRAGTFPGKARTQAQLAISADGRDWFLLGASPDLRAQIEAAPELHPLVSAGGDEIRQSPIAGAVLLNADIDHVLGLLLLRELQPLAVHATNSVHSILTKDNSMFAMLQRMPGQVKWNEFKPGEHFSLLRLAGDSGLRCRALSLGTHFPAYVTAPRRPKLSPLESSLGLIVESPSGKRLAYMPAVASINDSLLHQLESCNVLFFDGTFWSDDELIRMQASGQTAQQMGHMTVSGSEGSLSKLGQLQRPRRIYIHINNTNPMLNEGGPEYRQVREAGWEIAEDGWQFEL
ncbi:MAG TPA: pyrroloquinoline quinone biosynthesis protein PqqB [Candidatus Binatia bacterium]|jgi:pyrroloquinoline quinone biosynthesis protein B|nr:pyrroloquinoline quinone biosynthesis protein PqqB [Candidatus Binatia bacterium]